MDSPLFCSRDGDCFPAGFVRPVPADPPVTYEVQIDGESFQIEGGQRPIKVQSKLKKGTTYTLAVRVAITQVLRLNSVQMEYGMWAKVTDINKSKDLRVVQIKHDLGFSLTITDLGHALGREAPGRFVESRRRRWARRFGSQGNGLKRKELPAMKIGLLDGKLVKNQLQRLRRSGADVPDFRAFGREIHRQRGG